MNDRPSACHAEGEPALVSPRQFCCGHEGAWRTDSSAEMVRLCGALERVLPELDPRCRGCTVRPRLLPFEGFSIRPAEAVDFLPGEIRSLARRAAKALATGRDAFSAELELFDPTPSRRQASSLSGESTGSPCGGRRQIDGVASMDARRFQLLVARYEAGIERDAFDLGARLRIVEPSAREIGAAHDHELAHLSKAGELIVARLERAIDDYTAASDADRPTQQPMAAATTLVAAAAIYRMLELPFAVHLTYPDVTSLRLGLRVGGVRAVLRDLGAEVDDEFVDPGTPLRLSFCIYNRFDVACECGVVAVWPASPVPRRLETESPLRQRTALGQNARDLLWRLLERQRGNLPFWLSPRQVRVIPARTEFLSTAERLTQKLADAGVTADLERRRERLRFKVRAAFEDRVACVVEVGAEQEHGEVTLIERSTPDRPRRISLEKLEAHFRRAAQPPWLSTPPG